MPQNLIAPQANDTQVGSMQSIQPRTTQPSTLSNLFAISRFELAQLFFTVRGWIAIGAFAVVWYLILKYAIYEAAKWIKLPFIESMLGDMIDQSSMGKLLAWPVAEFIMFWLFSLFIFPLFSLIVTADQTSSDRAGGTLRFITLRADRDSVFFGRFIGNTLIMALLIIGASMATLAMAVYSDSKNLLDGFNSALIMDINLIIVIMPYVALMAMVSAAVNSSKMVVTVAVVGLGLSTGLINYAIYKLPFLQPLSYLIPGHQIPDLMSSLGWETLQHAVIPLCQTLGLLIIGRTIVKRSAL